MNDGIEKRYILRWVSCVKNPRSENFGDLYVIIIQVYASILPVTQTTIRSGVKGDTNKFHKGASILPP